MIEDKKKIINICEEALDRHAIGQAADRVALRYLPATWPADEASSIDITYGALRTLTCKFANALKNLGVQKGDVIFSLSPRIPELYTVALGSLRAGLVFSPLFSAFGPAPILSRMKKGNGKVIFSLASLFRKKVLPVLPELPFLSRIILLDDDGSLKDIPGAISFEDLMFHADPTPVLEKTESEDAALLHFTSGTTGEPKGALHTHRSVIYHRESGRLALDLHPGDIFWCTADPGWVTGTSYGIISGLCNGATLLIDSREFNATRWYEILSRMNVQIWYTAPTALRMLMKAGEELPKAYDFSTVRFAASVGEPLNPEVIKWVQSNMHLLLRDNWWQTETGGIMIANSVGLEVKLGSMGKPLAGIEVALVKTSTGSTLNFAAENESGEIAIRKGWASMFAGYLNNPQRYEKCFTGDWYLSGDLARKDHEGYFWFIGRKDDVIKTSGHLIGPFEVENILMDHPKVLEAAVIGLPDPILGELMRAYVVLRSGVVSSEEIRSQILSHARKALGAAIAPREIQFISTLPKTRSGKIMRRLLKARAQGLPEGDLSTLDDESGAK